MAGKRRNKKVVSTAALGKKVSPYLTFLIIPFIKASQSRWSKENVEIVCNALVRLLDPSDFIQNLKRLDVINPLLHSEHRLNYFERDRDVVTLLIARYCTNSESNPMYSDSAVKYAIKFGKMKPIAIDLFSQEVAEVLKAGSSDPRHNFALTKWDSFAKYFVDGISEFPLEKTFKHRLIRYENEVETRSFATNVESIFDSNDLPVGEIAKNILAPLLAECFRRATNECPNRQLIKICPACGRIVEAVSRHRSLKFCCAECRVQNEKKKPGHAEVAQKRVRKHRSKFTKTSG